MSVDAVRPARAVAWARLRPAVVPVLIGLMLAGALVLRLPGITQPSIELRETQSALRARAWYLGDGEGLPAAQRQVLHELRERVRLIEPPVLDLLASLHYRAAGENFWFPRLLSACSWVVGGIFLYLIGRRLTSRGGALVALAVYLVCRSPPATAAQRRGVRCDRRQAGRRVPLPGPRCSSPWRLRTAGSAGR